VHGPVLAPVAAPGGEVEGAVATADAAAAARLRFLLATLGGPGAASATVATGAGPAEAVVADPDGEGLEPWTHLADPEWRAHLAEAAAEAMSQFGRRDASEMQALLPGIGYRALARARGRAGGAPVVRRSGYTAAAEVLPLELRRPYANYFSVEEHRLRHRRFDGAMSGPIDRAVFTSGDAVTVLPFDPRRRAVLLVEQFRPGPYARLDPHPWCLEAVAGRCDAGEGPEATARREAREEAGLELGRMERIAAYYTAPGTLAEHITGYVGEADLDAAGGVHGLAEEDEDIRSLVLPLAEAMDLVAVGEVNNAPLLISLLWLAAQADRLVADWTR
jgi:nudix-type nucleoside diphosphatase (YffH/AdpP family)